MSSDTPFLLFKIECPVCKTLNEFELLRVGAYVEESRDSDFCPRNINWRFPRYQAFNPLAFFTATCSNCYYSRELTNEYKDWKNDANFRTYKLKAVKEKHLEEISASDSTIRLIGSHLDLSRFPNETAILKLMLAIYDELLYEYASHLDIGRFYLRVAWIFREMESKENPQVVLVRGLIQELGGKLATLQQAVGGAQGEIELFDRYLTSQLAADSLPAGQTADILTLRDQCVAESERLKQVGGMASQYVAAMSQLIDEFRRRAFGQLSEAGTMNFGASGSFTDFLLQLKSTWDGAVLSERDALAKAVFHYKKAFAGGRDIAPGNQQIQASYLIAELSRRLGNYDEAKQFFSSTIKSGQEFVYQHRNDQSRVALAKKILELAIEQGRVNLAAARPQ